MSDTVARDDGTFSSENIGGPALYALAGIRLWTDKCKLVTQTGSDYIGTYGKWMDDNGLSHESILVEVEEVTRITLKYNPADRGFQHTPHKSQEYLGYQKTHPYHIDAAATPAVKGVYMAQNVDRIVWRNLEKIKEKYGFKLMWEIEYSANMEGETDKLRKIRNVLGVADMWSINHNEASDLFHIPRDQDEDIINELMKLRTGLTLYRVGERGAYAVTPSQACFCPRLNVFGGSTDPTGCGNNSTGAAMYAYTEGYEPALVVAMANVSAAFNAAQYGPYPVFTPEVMAIARRLANEYREKVKS